MRLSVEMRKDILPQFEAQKNKGIQGSHHISDYTIRKAVQCFIADSI